jgi:hypothetical protein
MLLKKIFWFWWMKKKIIWFSFYHNLILNSGQKFRALRDQKKKYSNSCCPKKKILNETKNHNPPPCKLNGRSLNNCHLHNKYVVVPVDNSPNNSRAGTGYPSEAPEFTPGFEWGSCYSIFSFICMFCRSLFVLLCFFFWPLCCLFFFDIQILIAPLVSSNSSFIDCLINELVIDNSLGKPTYTPHLQKGESRVCFEKNHKNSLKLTSQIFPLWTFHYM